MLILWFDRVGFIIVETTREIGFSSIFFYSYFVQKNALNTSSGNYIEL